MQKPITVAAHFTAMLFISLAMYYLVQGDAPYTDEGMMHMPQINQYRNALDSGIYPDQQIVTMVPTYHWLIAICLKATHLPMDLDILRRLSLLLSFITLTAILWTAKAAQPERFIIRSWQILALPMLAPFLPLVYTDITGLLFPALAFGFYFRKRYQVAAVMACLALLFRQTNLIWLGLLFTMIYIDQNGFHLSRQAITHHCRQHWVFLLGIGLFSLFVYWNNGIAMGRYKNQHPAEGLFLGNIFFCMQAFAITFLPWLLIEVYRRRAVFKKPAFWAFLIAFCVMYLLKYRVVHPWNIFEPHFLRNMLLHAFMSKPAIIPIGLLLATLACMSWWEWPMRKPSAQCLWLFLMAGLLPVTLIEPRYYLPGFVLFLLLSAPRPRWQEYGLAIWLLGLSTFIAIGHHEHWFFL